MIISQPMTFNTQPNTWWAMIFYLAFKLINFMWASRPRASRWPFNLTTTDQLNSDRPFTLPWLFPPDCFHCSPEWHDMKRGVRWILHDDATWMALVVHVYIMLQTAKKHGKTLIVVVRSFTCSVSEDPNSTESLALFRIKYELRSVYSNFGGKWETFSPVDWFHTRAILPTCLLHPKHTDHLF